MLRDKANHISELSKLAQKAGINCMGKVIYLELCKRLKFDPTDK